MKTCSRKYFAVAVAAAIFLAGCGGGGSSGSVGESIPVKTLSWDPPTEYTDNTPLTPATDLDSFEIYVKETDSFSEADMAMASVSAIDPGTQQVATSFVISNLSPFLSQGTTYYVAIRAITKNGAKSDYSSSSPFSL